MAIKYIQERQGGANRSNGKLTRSRNLLYHVTSGSNPGDILLDKAIPADGSVHPDYPGFYCVNIDNPQRITGTEIDGSYVVQVNYSSNAADIPQPKDNQDKPPWKQKAYNISYGSVRVVVPQIKAYQSGDKQFHPSKPVVHPVTKEVLISDTIEIHPTLSFNYALESFQYQWIRYFLNTSNSNEISILGITFPSYNLLMTGFSAATKYYTNSNGTQTTYYEIGITIEDFGRETTKQLAYQGFMHKWTDNKIRPIQLKEGVYGYFDEKQTNLNISTPRFVDKNGAVLASNGTITDNHYGFFNDIYDRNWSVLSLPKVAV